MQDGSHAPQDAEMFETGCVFCQGSGIANILKETSNFVLAADHAPLLEGHLLIIPKRHYSCYGTVPAVLDQELHAFKQEIRHFFERYYAPVVFWEHGIFRQTVFHAHLHCFPFGATEYDLSRNLHSAQVRSQDDIRNWFATRGHYFYMEDAQVALLFEPEMERYMQIIQGVLWKGVAARTEKKGWRSPQQRYEEGFPLIEATIARWKEFQGAEHADKTRKASSR